MVALDSTSSDVGALIVVQRGERVRGTDKFDGSKVDHKHNKHKKWTTVVGLSITRYTKFQHMGCTADPTLL